MPIDEENDATTGIQMITRSYLCLRVIGNIVTSPEKDDWLQQTRLRIATAENGSILRYFSIFPLQGMRGICCHVSVFLIRPTPTHNSTLQVILIISIFRFADPTYASGNHSPRTHKHTHTNTHTNTLTHKHTHTYKHKHTHLHTNTLTHTLTHTH